MLKTLVKLLAFATICFCVIEQSYRYYAMGPDAFNPVKFNSYNQLLLTDLVEASPYPAVYYQLKPGLDDWFRGKKIRSNSHGLADKEYELKKPTKTFRVAVLGSSWTMATGVPQDLSYHALLEARLREQHPDTNIEFLNFAVEMYGLREIVGTLENRVMVWEPDMILVAITSYTSYLRWLPADAVQRLPDRTNPFFHSYAFRALDNLLQTGLVIRSLEERPVVGSDQELYEAQVIRAFREVAAVAERADVPASIMWLSFASPGKALSEKMESISQELGINYIKGHEAIGDKPIILRKNYKGNTGRHPNAAAHEILADVLFEELQIEKLLPVLNEY